MQTMEIRVKAKPSGWQMINQRMRKRPVMPEGVTRWDRELYKRGLTEQMVLSDPSVMRDWVGRHVGNAFIPEKVLEKLGIGEMV